MEQNEDLSKYRYTTDIQMRFSDIDVFGHVNNTIYLHYMDLGKLGYIHQVLGTLFDPQLNAMVIANINCEYLAPTFYGEPIKVLTRVDAVGVHSVTFEQRVINEATSQVKCACRTVMVGFDVPTASSMEIPERWRALLGEYEGRNF